jgi:glucokinase
LNPGKPVHGGTIAVIAPGTGLGESYLTWDGSRYFPYASEGGHSDFAPTNQLALKLHQYLLDRFGHVSCERVCSGNGIPNIYAFLRDEKYSEEPDWLAEQLERAKDPTPIIAKAALDKKRSCKLCSLTMNTFVSILGAESGNLALKVLSSGGVYLGGGIPPRILPYLDSGIFMQAFLHKGRLASVLSQMPVHVILNRKVALLGAAYYGLDRWQD